MASDLGALPAAAAGASSVGEFNVQALVQSQSCVDASTVQVVLTAKTNSPSPTKYRWDLNGDGRWDTAASSSPTVTTTYAPGARVTVTVGARTQLGQRDWDRESFQAIRCA